MIDRGLNYGREILTEYARTSATRGGRRILDVGAGGGADLSICKSAIPGAQLSALECYPPNVASLQRQSIDVHSIDIERQKFPFPDTEFDLIIANQILEHCKEIFWIFHEVSRTLKVGGDFYVGLPNLASFHSRLLLLAGFQPSCIRVASAHVRGFTKRDLVSFVHTCFPGGYELTLFKGSNFYPFPPVMARPLAKLFPGSAACIFLVFRKLKPYDSQFLKYPVGLETNYWIGTNLP